MPVLVLVPVLVPVLVLMLQVLMLVLVLALMLVLVLVPVLVLGLVLGLPLTVWQLCRLVLVTCIGRTTAERLALTSTSSYRTCQTASHG